jgi:hypothetical protein
LEKYHFFPASLKKIFSKFFYGAYLYVSIFSLKNPQKHPYFSEFISKYLTKIYFYAIIPTLSFESNLLFLKQKSVQLNSALERI